MGGGDTKQTTSTTQSASPSVLALTDKLANGLSGQLDKGTAVYGNPLYTGLGTTTTNGANALAAAGNNPSYANALSNTMNEFGAIASGQRMGANDSAWNAARDNVVANTNAAFNANGRFAGGSNVASVAQGLGNVELARLQGNEARQMSAASALPGLYSASLAPAQAQISAGSIFDADSLARRQAEAELFNRQNNVGWDTFGKASSILAGTAGAAGTNTTQLTPQAPWWQSALGGAIGIGSLFL